MSKPAWLSLLRGDPRPWLLDRDTPAVRYSTLRHLPGTPSSRTLVNQARREAMAAPPLRTILEAQAPEGWWAKPGAGYSPKYRSTVWQLLFLDQLDADGSDARVKRAGSYVLEHTQADSGGFAATGAQSLATPPSERVIHCLNGNLVRALIGFGWLGDARLDKAIDWQAHAITGSAQYFPAGTCGAGFRCAANDSQPCAWGAVKAAAGLARIPVSKRTPAVHDALAASATFLLSHDPAIADYPMGWGNTKPSRLWFRLGFPSAYVADVLENLQVLADLGYGRDPRLGRAIEWVLSKQDEHGRWRNEYAYPGRMWLDLDRQGQPSKWVTLRVCRLLSTI